METFDNGDVITWAVDLEEGALKQARNAAALPFVISPVAVMADGHQGYGVPVGSVIATDGAISVYAVGSDIGCGVIASRTSLTSSSLPDNLDGLHAEISYYIPAGLGQEHANRQALAPKYEGPTELTTKQENTINNQFGSLGSGNHFVEVCLDEEDRVWLMLHSGSRGIGKQIADIHLGIASKFQEELPDPELAFLVDGTKEFSNYISDMLWAQDYAFKNRQRMMDLAYRSFHDFMGPPDRYLEITERINTHHNFAAKEIHNGKEVWITRKGAIKAALGDRGIIPGSMGTGSYITTGLGNSLSYNSTSHGAGRKMSRGKARKAFTVEDLTAQMGGRSWNKKDAEKLLDEAPGSYKDIGEIIAIQEQAGLLKVDHKLTAILNYKGVS